MGKTVRMGSSESLEVKGKNVIGIMLYSYMQASAVNVMPSSTSDQDLDNLNIVVKLNRKGLSYQIVNGKAIPYILHTTINTEQYGFAHPVSAGFFPVVTQDVAVKGVLSRPFQIFLPGIINLDGDDVLTIEVQANNGVFAGNTDTTASYFYFDIIEGIGIETQIPTLQMDSVQGAQSQYVRYIGDNVSRITFINLDKALTTNLLASDDIVTAATFNSSLLDYVDTNIESWTKTLNNNPYSGFYSNVSFGKSRALFGSNVPTQNASLTLTLNSANVVAGKNYVVWSQFIADKATALKAAAMSERFAAKNAKALYNL